MSEDRATAQNDDPPTRGRLGIKFLRRLAACGVFAFALFGLIFDKFRTCAIERTPEGAVETCRAPEITDASVIAVALLLLVLALPDFDEISAVGVRVKRRLDAVDQRTNELQSGFLALTTQLSQATASASVVNNFGYLKPDNSLDEIAPRLAVAAGKEVDPSSTDSPAGELMHANSDGLADELARDAGPEGTARALLTARLIEAWEELQEILLLGPRFRAARDSSSSRAHFADVFAEEINTVRQARNSVAHAQPISMHDIELAVDAANNLIDIFRRRVEA